MWREHLNSLRSWRSFDNKAEVGRLYQYEASPKGRTATVYLLGMDDAKVTTFMDNADRLTRRFERIVFVVTSGNLAPFLKRRQIVEVFPDPVVALRLSGERHWRMFLEQRREVLRMKWQPDWALSFGWQFNTYVDKFEIED